MIIRRLASTLQLITQPDHAALSARIMQLWHQDHFPDNTRKPSILHAIEEHDAGWAEIDQTLVVDDATGQLVDFMGISDALKRETSWRGIERLAHDPYAAALVAQHRLHVYGRYTERPEWQAFFADVAAARDMNLRAAGADSLEDLLRDYRFVRLGDLASLAFCNNWPRSEEYGYVFALEGTSLVVTPDPLNGRTIAIDIEAREIEDQWFAHAADARRVIAAARSVKLTGRFSGSGGSAS
jgi:hypothetical protein